MKIKKMSIFEVWYYVLVALSTGVFLILPAKLDFWRNVLTWLLLLFTLVYFATQKIPRRQIKILFGTYVIVFISIVTIESLLSIEKYGYTFEEFFYGIRQYLWFLAVIPLFFMMKKKGIDTILRGTIVVTSISLTIRFLTWFIHLISGIVLFPNILYEYGILWGRNGSVRIDASPLIGVVVVALYYFYNKTKAKRYLMGIALVLGYLIIVTQSRTIILSSLACLIIMFVLKKRKSNRQFLIFFFVIVIFSIGFQIGIFDKLLEYLNLDKGPEGLGYRYYEFSYFLSLLRHGNWKLGIGILSQKNSMANSVLFGNLDTQMYIEDIGILEMFVQFGLLSIPLYLFLYLSLFVVMKKCFKLGYSNYGVLLLGLLSYLFIVSIPLNLFSIQRSFSLPIILAIMGYIESEIKMRDKSKLSMLKQ